ncbi:endonuclease [Nocardioides sp. ChNu-153]|uniref:endonuclease n=1 Tax=unclassified Nocardioides TaxID=2615069 RepID=UPI0024076474|nr:MULTISPECIES: endonuclease [unclassified Nocardioides]MDF9715810.1 endonuclease [Nocardioides sp. ChNu-99]MDN7120808.1 endonuclease [Nocardioides sp. ChNu-153]
MTDRDVLRRLLDRHGTTFAEDAGIRLTDEPAPLWQLLVLTLLLSARIRSDVAVAATRELLDAGWRTPQRMQDSPRRSRVAALGRAGYRRYDERTATRLGELADAVLDRYAGDLRRLRDGADGTRGVEEELQGFGGIGPAGAAIFCREVQGVWPGLAPYVDDLAARGAERLGLPSDADALAGLLDRDDLPRLVAACVRAARDAAVADAAADGDTDEG